MPFYYWLKALLEAGTKLHLQKSYTEINKTLLLDLSTLGLYSCSTGPDLSVSSTYQNHKQPLQMKQ